MRESVLRQISHKTAVAIRRSWVFYGSLIFCAVSFSIYSLLWLVAAAHMEKSINDQIADLSDQGIDFKSAGVSVSGYPFFLRGRIDNAEFTKSRIWLWSVYRIHIEASPLNVESVRLVMKGPQFLRMWRNDGFKLDPGSSVSAIRPVKPSLVTFSGSAQSFIVSLEEDDVRFELRDTIIGMGEMPSQAGVRVAHILGNILPEAVGPSRDGRPDTGFSVVFSDLRRQLDNGAEAVTATVGPGNGQLEVLRPALEIPLLEMAGLLTRPTDKLRDREIKLRHLKLDLAQGGFAIGTPDQSATEVQRPPVTRISSSGELHIDEGGFPAGRFDISLEDARALEEILVTYATINPADQDRLISLSSLFIEDDTAAIPIMMEGGYMRIAGRKVFELPRFFAPQDKR